MSEMSKGLKTIITIIDNREVYRIRKCWYYEKHPVHLDERIDEIRRSTLLAVMRLRKAVQKVSISFDEFTNALANAFNQIEK